MNKKEHTKCLITVLYGDYDLIPRRGLWRNIVHLSVGICEEPWLVTGDFNAVIDDSEVSGNAADTSTSMAEFQECVTTAELHHLPFTGAPFTWHNCSEGGRSLWKRLDRMLVNENWLTVWPATKYVSATPRTSDHAPLIIQGDEGQKEASMFRFENFVTKIPGFISCVEDVWKHHIVGTAMYTFTRKLKALKPVLRELRRQQGDLSQNVHLAEKFLYVAQSLNQEFQHDNVLILLEKCCRIVYCKAVALEVNMLQQRAKLRWLKGGDICSKIFFRKINARRASQRVFQIHNANGLLVMNYPDVIKEFVNFYQQLFGGARRTTQIDLGHLQALTKNTISESEADQIISPIQRQEIKDALFDIDEDSAPGPDGFSSGFFKSSWAVIGEDFCRAVCEFFDSNRMLKQLNTTLLVLIPKVNMPVTVADFRPIACCNVIYKVISKIMVKRMQLVLDKLIDNTQNAFVPGRCISSNVLLAQELLSGYNQKKLPPRCTIKVDLQKAYDMVDWEYLLAVLRLFKFPAKFISWVEQCITTASFSISINGGIHGFFQSTRGLRQGDPISPYLFVLVMESFHLLLQQKVKSDSNFNYHWRCKELGIVNLSFTDDLLLFCKADLHSVSVLKAGLMEFKQLSGLQANAQKSQIITSKAAAQQQSQIQEIMGFSIGSLPIKYLGVPLTSSKLTMADCNPLIQKIESRIAGWNQLNLSYAGRVQLIKSVLSSLHLYWSSIFILPKGVVTVIEQKFRKFLWKGTGNFKVAWDTICHPLSHGGLGIRKIRKGIEFQVGDGNSFKLWLDPWLIDGPLVTQYPSGPIITGLPTHSCLNVVIDHGRWKWPADSHTEIAEITSMLPAIHPGSHDQVVWKNASGKYSSVDAYKLFTPPSYPVLWASLFRGPFITPRHTFILWLAILGRLSTVDKPWCNSGNQNCILCDQNLMETHSHLFFECTYSKKCLEIMKDKVKFKWPHLEWKLGIIWASKRWRGPHLLNAASRASLAAIVYFIWQERNGRIFQGKARSAEGLSKIILEHVRCRIISDEIKPSSQAFNLYRIWHIAWNF
ncbi:UNVERIFIED_CONTAM: putative ribonuclease H protein [Sesamum radiatum]|uniref:Ribonuclease H protein n=1 Tax=Sesamum radiatum TaxID=300843 RepID=A0AAW2JMC0_SESRA